MTGRRILVLVALAAVTLLAAPWNSARAGVRVTSTRYNDTFHDFVMLNALADTPATRSAIAQTNAFLRSILE